MFRAQHAPECSMWPIDPTGYKNTSLVYRILVRFFVEFIPVLPEYEK
jgi:hypothetical protein